MAMNKALVTPRATLSWPKLNFPDYGTDKYPNPEGSWNTKALFNEDEPDFQNFISRLMSFNEQAEEFVEGRLKAMKKAQRDRLKEKLGAKPKPLYTPVYDPETEEPTGQVEMRFKMKYSYKSRKTGEINYNYPKFRDATGQEITDPPLIGGGSVARIQFRPSPFLVDASGMWGLTLNLTAIQIISLVSHGERSDDEGFEEEEDGYQYSEKDAASRNETPAAKQKPVDEQFESDSSDVVDDEDEEEDDF